MKTPSYPRVSAAIAAFLFTACCSFFSEAQLWTNVFLRGVDYPWTYYAQFFLSLVGLPLSLLFFLRPERFHWFAAFLVSVILAVYLYGFASDSYWFFDWFRGSSESPHPFHAFLFLISRFVFLLPSAVALFLLIRYREHNSATA